MTEAVILGWVGVTGLIGLNGFAAGIVAVLHEWRSSLRRASRIVVASTTSGLLPASYFMVIPAATAAERGEFGVMALAGAVVFVIAAVASLPGAIVLARKLARPGDEFRTFE